MEEIKAEKSGKETAGLVEEDSDDDYSGFF